MHAPKLQLGPHPEGVSNVLAILNFLIADVFGLHAIFVDAAFNVVQLVGQRNHLIGVACAKVLGTLDGSTEILVDYGGEG